MEWEICALSGADCERFNHTGIVLENAKKESHPTFFTFGGSLFDEKGEAMLNDLTALQFSSGKYDAKAIACSSARTKQLPLSRKSHSLVHVPPLRKQQQKSQNFDFMDEGEQLSPRRKSKLEERIEAFDSVDRNKRGSEVAHDFHTAATSLQQQAILFGGVDHNSYLNDLWILTFQPEEKQYNWQQVEFKQSDKQPEPRANHSACLVEMNNDQQQYMYIYGGYNGSKALSDMWRFDLETQSWEQVDDSINGEKPCARYGHTANVMDFSPFIVQSSREKQLKMLVACGFNDNDLFLGNAPLLTTTMVRYTPIVMRSKAIAHVVSNYLADFWLFDFTTRKWERVSMAYSTMHGRYEHSCSYIGRACFFIFGGYSTNETMHVREC